MEGRGGVRSVHELKSGGSAACAFIGFLVRNRYTATREPGPLVPPGFALLEGMADLGFGLEPEHMDEKRALQALDSYPGTILLLMPMAKAYKGCRGHRHLPDQVIHGPIERDGVIGIVPFNKFLDLLDN